MLNQLQQRHRLAADAKEYSKKLIFYIFRDVEGELPIKILILNLSNSIYSIVINNSLIFMS